MHSIQNRLLLLPAKSYGGATTLIKKYFTLGTHKEAEKCLNHVERILKTKATLFHKPSKLRRSPV